MLTMKNSKKMHANLNKYQVENCPAFPGRNLISACNRRPDGNVNGSGRDIEQLNF